MLLRIFAIVALSCSGAVCDTIRLTDGRILEGKVVSRDGDTVVIHTGRGSLNATMQLASTEIVEIVESAAAATTQTTSRTTQDSVTVEDGPPVLSGILTGVCSRCEAILRRPRPLRMTDVQRKAYDARIAAEVSETKASASLLGKRVRVVGTVADVTLERQGFYLVRLKATPNARGGRRRPDGPVFPGAMPSAREAEEAIMRQGRVAQSMASAHFVTIRTADPNATKLRSGSGISCVGVISEVDFQYDIPDQYEKESGVGGASALIANQLHARCVVEVVTLAHLTDMGSEESEKPDSVMDHKAE